MQISNNLIFYIPYVITFVDIFIILNKIIFYFSVSKNYNMSLPNKTLCEFTKNDLDNYENKIKKMIKKPKHMCKKCLRVSSDKNYLCKPSKI